MMVDPNDLNGALEAIELGVRELGMRCVGELVQYIHGWRTDGREILPVVQRAVELDVPLLFHISSEVHAERLARLAEKFPRARFIAAHYAGGRSWRRGLQTVRDLPNVWVEIMLGREERVPAVIDAVGTSRITLGTDFGVDDRPDLRYLAGNWLLECLARLKLSDADIERICSGNAKEVMRLED
jgi:predicted TIM-barrel fold metal-dependent hydrolase